LVDVPPISEQSFKNPSRFDRDRLPVLVEDALLRLETADMRRPQGWSFITAAERAGMEFADLYDSRCGIWPLRRQPLARR